MAALPQFDLLLQDSSDGRVKFGLSLITSSQDQLAERLKYFVIEA
jgi:hypothetical protein